MSPIFLPSSIFALYALSLLLSLIVLVLSLLDLGFGSLFLGIVGPCVTFVHHGGTALFLHKSAEMSIPLIASIPNVFTVGVLCAVWVAGSIVVTLWGFFYLDGSAQMVTQVVGTAGTVVAQGLVGALESIVLLAIFVTLICVRRREKLVRSVENRVNSESCEPLHRMRSTIPKTSRPKN